MGRKFQLNPAFAASHGLVTKHQSSTPQRLDLVIKQARATGKLNASNLGLNALPDRLFDLRSGIQVDVSMENSGPLQIYGEDEITLVDVSDNELDGKIDERFTQFCQVESLRLKRCGWTSLATSLASLTTLTILDLSGNKLEELDLSLLALDNLKELDLSSNQLQRIHSSSLVVFPRLTSLDISHNKLVDLEDISNMSCEQLRTFRCGHNNLTLFPPPFLESSKRCLQYLEASHNPLGDSKLDLSAYTELQRINLSLTKLEHIPSISRSVACLDLNMNKITSIQGLFSSLNGDISSLLVDLLLCDNNIADIDVNEIQKCTKMKRLDLSMNRLKKLPYQLGFLPELHRLVLTGNALYGFRKTDIDKPQVILQILRDRAPKEDSPQQIESPSVLSNHIVQNQSINLIEKVSDDVDLNQVVRDLKASPEIAIGITGQLLLDKNNLKTIPEELLTRLPNVTEVSISNNKLAALPASLCTDCNALKRLSLAHNWLTTSSFENLSIPLAFSNSLIRLNLSSNRLKTFPMEILSQFKVLDILDLSMNKMESVANWIWLPPTLTHLGLSNNAIVDIDLLVLILGAYCPKLQSLQLESNHIKRFPSSLGLLRDITCLQHLNLRGNPQHSIRYQMLEKSCRDQLTYLYNRLTADQKAISTQRIQEIKNKSEIDPSISAQATGANNKEAAKQAEPSSSSHVVVKIKEEPVKRISLKREPFSLVPANCIENNDAMSKNEQPSSDAPTALTKQEEDLLKIEEFKNNIQSLSTALDKVSISNAKRIALKKTLAMERSKLIREERRLGLRK